MTRTGPLPRGLVDTHCHIFEYGFETGPTAEPRTRDGEWDAYQRFGEDYGITRALVVGYDENGYHGNSDYVAGLAEEHSWLIPLRYAPSNGPLPAAMSSYPPDADAAARLAERLLRAAEDGAAPRIVSLNIRPEALAPLTGAMRRLRETWFLIAHLGLPGPVRGPDDAAVRLAPLWELASFPNVSVKLSGQYAASSGGYPHEDVAVIVDLVADRMGLGALTWGSDFSPCLTAVSLEESVHCRFPSGASDGEREAIYFGNAERMYRQYWGGPG